jgi:hypothetical protein
MGRHYELDTAGATDPLWMKLYAGRCPVGLQPTDLIRGESRDLLVRRWSRPEDPGFRRGSVEYGLPATTAVFLASLTSPIRPAALRFKRLK